MIWVSGVVNYQSYAEKPNVFNKLKFRLATQKNFGFGYYLLYLYTKF